MKLNNTKSCLESSSPQTHLTDLRDVTNYVHYENFRCRKLAGVAGTDKVLRIMLS